MKNFNFKTLLLAIGLVVASVQPSMAAWLGNAGIEVNGTWYKASQNIDDGNWLKSKSTINNANLGAVTSLELGGQFDTYDNSQTDNCDWNGNIGVWITITTNSGTQKVNYRLSCYHAEKSGNNNIWKTTGTTGKCGDKDSYGTYTQSISSWDPGVYKLKVHWFSPSGVTMPSSDDVATFTINPKVTFDKNNGSGSMSAQTVTYNESTTLNANTFTAPTGYYFNGWNTKSDGTGTSYSDKGSIKTTTNVTLYAQWAPYSYTISYKDQGNVTYSGSNLSSLPTTHTYGTETNLVDGERSGYDFLGWFDNSGCTGTAITSIGATAKTANFTLYAKWKISTTYSLVVAMGTGITSVSGGKSGQTTIPFDGGTISATVKEGYEFDKWTADPAANATFADANSATTTVNVDNGSVTVTANAKANSYNINYPSGTGYTISNNPATGATDETIQFTVTPASKYSVVVKQDGNILTKGGSNTYSFTMPAHEVYITVETSYNSNWWMFGDDWGGWDAKDANTQFDHIYRNMEGVYYAVTTINKDRYFRFIDKNTGNWYQLTTSKQDTEIAKNEKKQVYANGNNAIHATSNLGTVWAVIKTTDTKYFRIEDAVSTFYTVSVSEPTDHSTALTLKDEAWDLATNQYSANDTYVLSVTAATGYRAVLKVNSAATDWTSTSSNTYTYEAQPTDNTTLTVEYVQQYAVTHGYYTGCTEAMGTYTVKANETTINSGKKVDDGTTVTFTATPQTGYQFDGWYTTNNGETPESTDLTYAKEITAATALYAKFSKKVWTVTVAKAGTGDGTLIPDAGSYSVNQVDGQSFTATPAKGSWFAGWTKSPEDGGDWTGDTFKPTKDVTITATFTKYTSTLSVTEVNVGKTATVTFTKDEHYSNPTISYELWNSDKSAKVTDGTTFTLTETGATFVAQVAGTYTVKAIVKQNETTVDEIFSDLFTIGAVYTVNFAVSPLEKGCTVTPATPKEDVEIDTPFAISASAGTGYHFNRWAAVPDNTFTFEDTTSASTSATMTAAAVTSTITATFSPNAYVVRFNANCESGKQQATGKMEDQSFEYDEDAKALTENAFVRLGYNFLGWSADASATEATYADKAEVSNLTSDNGGVVNLYAIWQLKEDCSIEVVDPGEDGTIDPSEKVTNANVEGTVYTYTFTPASDAVTFMNWTITNAICVEGTNERSNPVKIKTYGEATIRANVKENLVSVTLKVLPDDYWGYFKVNGNNVASGTVINVGEKTTATVFGNNTNFGYKFDGFEYTEGYDDLITYDEENGLMQGKGKVGKVTIIAKFSVDTYTGWQLFGNWDKFGNGIEFTKHADQNTKKIAYATKELYDGDYEFILEKGGNWYGNEGTIDYNYSYGWKFTTGKGNCKFKPAEHSGPQTYIFRLDYTDENNPTITMLRQDRDGHWFPEGTTVYFNNHNENSWGRSIIRFGCDGGMAEAYDMTLVPGTANLYSYTFPQGYKYFQAYQIVNNYGWTGAKDKSGETKYGIYNIGEGDYKIGRSTEHLQNAAAPGCVIKIQTNHYKGDYEVEYYKYDYWGNVDDSRYTVNFTQTDYTGGTLKVEQLDNNDGSARTTLTNGLKVDQSRYIMITATPKIGYKFVKLTAKMQGWDNAEDHYESTWKYAVQNNVESITAEFAPVNTYTFYVKNAASTDETWHSGGTKDVYLYYANGSGTSYWGWPGLMATPMDNKHEWYKVEMTNAYFDIHHWRLNNGAGADCPQTDEYVTNNGVPEFNSQPMEGKYYELVYDKEGDKYETYKLQAATTTPSFYRVVSEDGKYTSNVATEGQKVSFFATTAGAKLQKSGESGWTDVPNGSISIDADNVYVATISEDAISNLEVYTGNYYIRTDGATGGWGDYKDPSKNNAMTFFTPRPGETYSYYWIQNLGKFGEGENSGSINVKAKVANDFNDNLAGEIANDANTNIYGNINKTTNGSNVRFSYEPTTNAFERAILSGSADDSYLNIVGANIYSDVSCKAEFALDMDTYKTNPKACKLRDISDWVYEMTIYAKVPDVNTAIGVDMYSLYNGNRSTLLDDKVIMAKGTGAATYKLRVTYDFKKNRITTSWSPSSQTITETMTVNADIQFLQVEKGDVSQITITKEVNDVTVKSLEYLLYVLEIEDPGESKRGEEHYRISLPFDCRVSDIYGIEGYVELDDAGRPISGDWGIQEYDGKTRAEQGWYDNSPIQNFWRWLRKDEVMHAGQGYSISVDKAALKWSTIGEEVTRTICDANGTNCQDVTTTEDRAAHRLYFPSTNPGFDLANSTNSPTTYEPITCTKTQGNRNIYDSDWRFMGSTAYNNIKTNEVNNQRAGDKAVPEYLYVLNTQETEYVPVSTTDAAGFIFRSFGAYMFQFHGTIAWNIYTQSHPETHVSAPRYSATQHTPLKMHVDVMEGEEMVAQAFVELNDKATTGFDQKKDLTLMKSSKVARAYTTTEGIDYAANCLPFESTILPFTINTLHAGDYTLHMEGADNVAVYLIDYQHQTETLISAGNVEVELGKGSSSDRFALRFDVAAAPTDIKNANGETMMNDGQKTQKLLRNGNIYLINGGRVYNATGTMVR